MHEAVHVSPYAVIALQSVLPSVIFGGESHVIAEEYLIFYSNCCVHGGYIGKFAVFILSKRPYSKLNIYNSGLPKICIVARRLNKMG